MSDPLFACGPRRHADLTPGAPALLARSVGRHVRSEAIHGLLENAGFEVSAEGVA